MDKIRVSSISAEVSAIWLQSSTAVLVNARQEYSVDFRTGQPSVLQHRQFRQFQRAVLSDARLLPRRHPAMQGPSILIDAWSGMRSKAAGSFRILIEHRVDDRRHFVHWDDEKDDDDLVIAGWPSAMRFLEGMVRKQTEKWFSQLLLDEERFFSHGYTCAPADRMVDVVSRSRRSGLRRS